MLNKTKEFLKDKYGINNNIINFINKAEEEVNNKFNNIDRIKEFNQYKIISAMHKMRLSSTDFHWTTGYGYGDIGREKVEAIYADIFNADDALVRPTIASGTHALSLTLSGLLKANDEFISITGPPYDTLQKVIGINGSEKGTLIDYGVKYKEVELVDNEINTEKVLSEISNKTKLVLIQRSIGYSIRRAISIKSMERVIRKIKNFREDIIIMVDNCYGEFTETLEPTDIGADIIAGSLIKNPGGGLALSGGYIVGKKDLVELVANRSTAPGLGKDCGLTFGTSRTTLQGLYLSPGMVSNSIKGALLFGSIFKKLGFKIIPDLDDIRSDIIQGIILESPDRVVEFCKGIQEASVVDSFVSPLPWDMPGYEEKVVMAAGGFIDGSSIELSADAPIRQPYIVYYQGGLSYDHCRFATMKVIKNLIDNDLIDKTKLN